MFSRFTEKAVKAVLAAQNKAKVYELSEVGTAVLLLGLLEDKEGKVATVLGKLGSNMGMLRESIEESLEESRGLAASSRDVRFSKDAKAVLAAAWGEARDLNSSFVSTEHLFLAIYTITECTAAEILEANNVYSEDFRAELLAQLSSNPIAPSSTMYPGTTPIPPNTTTSMAIDTPTLDLYTRDLTWFAKENRIDPTIGRVAEIDRMIQTLCRRTKNNPVLVGEAGVGKTALVEGLAKRMVEGKVPGRLRGHRLVSLDLGLLVAGTKYRGEFEDRLKKVMSEATRAKNVIIFIDEVHSIVGAGNAEGTLDVANLIKPSLARGEIQCIGATTLGEYRKHIESDAALARRFQLVLVAEPSSEDAIAILSGLRSRYEMFHGVTITDAAVTAAVTMSVRYITDRRLPDKAVDVMDEAAARIMIRCATDPEAPKIVDEEVVSEIVASYTGVPVTKLSADEFAQLSGIEAKLLSRIVGQDEAVKAVVRSVKRSRVGLRDPGRPAGSFLFLGPTGVGKSELAKQLAEHVFGSKDALIRIDMSEYADKHSGSKLIGSPPGYVGYSEGGQLTEAVRRRPHCIVLFDEIEKASPDVVSILLQLLDDGRLTDGLGRVVDFTNATVIMTSNVGAKFIQKSTSFGFTAGKTEETAADEMIVTKVKAELANEFKPEFLNRIDDMVIFHQLTRPNMSVIVEIMLSDMRKRLNARHIEVYISKSVKDLLAELGYDKKLGARQLRRVIQERIEDKLVDCIISEGKVGESMNIKISAKGKDIVFKLLQLPDSEVAK